MKEDSMKVVMIDFDGTITQENLFPEIGKVRNHAFEAIKTLQKRGWTCCLWTCRTGETLEKAKRFLETNGVFMDYYNESPYDNRNFAGRKPIADVYIDDAAYPVKLNKDAFINWDEIVRVLTGQSI